MKSFRNYLFEATLANLSSLDDKEINKIINNMIKFSLFHIKNGKKKYFPKKYIINFKNKKVNIILELFILENGNSLSKGYEISGGYELVGNYIDIVLEVSSPLLFKKNIQKGKVKKEIYFTVFHEFSHLERYQGKRWKNSLDSIEKDQQLRTNKSLLKNKINLDNNLEKIQFNATTMNSKDYKRLSIEIDANVSALKHFYDKSSLKSKIKTLKDLIYESGNTVYLEPILKNSKKYREIFMKKLAQHGIIFRNSGY